MARAIPIGLAQFNRKMPFYFPWIPPISDLSVQWHNGKQSKSPLVLGVVSGP